MREEDFYESIDWDKHFKNRPIEKTECECCKKAFKNPGEGYVEVKKIPLKYIIKYKTHSYEEFLLCSSCYRMC